MRSRFAGWEEVILFECLELERPEECQSENTSPGRMQRGPGKTKAKAKKQWKQEAEREEELKGGRRTVRQQG